MNTQSLRGRAEDAVRMTRQELTSFAGLDASQLLYELQVHHAELEIQNESLRSALLTIEQSKERYQTFFDHAPVGCLVLDAAGVIVRANLAAGALLGAVCSRLLGQPLAAFVAAHDLAMLDRYLRSVGPDVRPAWEVRLKPARGHTVHIRMEAGGVPGAAQSMVVLTDITNQIQHSEAEQRSREERERALLVRISELEEQNRRLEAETAAQSTSAALQAGVRSRDNDRLQSLGMLAAGVAHDFNNLLVGVLGNADLLLQTPGLPDAWRAPLTLIKRAGRGASDLTRQLLMFAGLGRLSMAPVDLSHVVSHALELVRVGLPPSIQFTSQLEPSLPVVLADRGQAHQVVMNLVTNAIEALNGAGQITIRLREEVIDSTALETFQPFTDAEPGRFVVLSVEDSGVGIDRATLSRIFDPFFTTKFTGRGLGLAAALGIVQGHHGALRVRSKAGQGTCFEVAFPLANVRRESTRPSEAAEQEWEGSGSVLLIDDDDMVRTVVEQLLARMGFEVTAASNGREGLEKFCSHTPRFDLVVLDWLMPGLSGEQVLKALRELEPDLKVVLISGYSIQDLAADDHAARVQKPMTMAELRDAVRTLLGQSEPAALVPRQRRSTDF